MKSALVNQRKSFRVEPSKAAPVEVRIGVEELEFVGRLQDISADGVSVLMDAGVEARLASVVDVSLRLRPPPDDKTLAFRASIRNRTRVEGENSTSYGLRLDPTGTPDFPEQQQHIVSYVMMRQRDLLQSRIGL